MKIIEKKSVQLVRPIHLEAYEFDNRSLNFLNLEYKNLEFINEKFFDEKSRIKNKNKPNIIKRSNSSNAFLSSIKKDDEVVENDNNSSCITNILDSITFIPNAEENIKGNKLGSLYQLFNSEYFDIHLLIGYLDKRVESGVVDTLLNFMHKNFINESFFYIPQICTMITYKPYYESLENYILDRCVDQIKFSLKIHWIILSYIDSAEDQKIKKKYDKLAQRIEMTLVNGRRATLSSFKLYNSLNLKSEKEVYKHALDKEARLNYFEKTIKFYSELKVMCEKLKEFPKENKSEPHLTRNAVMRKRLQKFNKNIKKMRANNTDFEDTTSYLYNGFILPFDDSISTMDNYNSLIVNFLPEQSFCFSTKARVPVKITVETVRVLECEFWDDLILEEEEENDDENILIRTEENIKIEENYLNKENLNNKPMGQETFEEEKIIEFCSVDDFFKKMNNSEIKKQKQIKKQLAENYNSEYQTTPKNELLKTDSILSNIQPHVDENFLYDNSEDTINPFGAKWSEIIKQIKEKSIYKNFETYSVKSFIAKANDDLRQEVMTMQLIKRFDDIFKQAELPLRLRPYEILITSSSSGLIEFLPNTISIDALKKNLPDKMTLNIFFRNFFTNNFEEAQKNFAESLAAYSIITYMIQIRDRHNGNILLDMNGNIIHIDFGFILGISPGNLNFENAPFKLTSEYVDILDGPESNIFHYFKSLILRGLIELKKHVDSFVKIIDVMSKGSKMPCFSNPSEINNIITKFTERFHVTKTETEYIELVEELINNSIYNWRTVQYDNFQKLTNDIRP